MTHAVVTGATSVVGWFLLPRLGEAGHAVSAVSRQPPADKAPAHVQWHALDIQSGLAGLVSAGLRASVLVHLAPIWLLPPLMEEAAALGVTRVLAFSSTSRFTKDASSDVLDRRLAARLAAAEDEFVSAARRLGIDWTIFRPTMIYAAGHDRNVSSIARFIERFGFYPVAGGGRGLRQPVHASDLAAACVAALGSPKTVGRAYNLGGGTRLSYADLVREVFRGLGRPARVVSVPVPVLRAALEIARRLPGLGHLTPAVADRMNDDMCFDWLDAAEAFGYDPRPFVFPQ